jgi:anaerobic magnesium-protoporphyrin IX monomethyl ester cyclase
MTPRLLLLTPPGWNYLWQPHLSLPSLSAYLRQHGCQVDQRDLNLSFFEALADGTALAPLHQRMVAIFQALDEGDSLSVGQQRRYADLPWAACQPVEALKGNLRQAMTALREPASYYHIPTCSQQSALLNQVWEMVWATFERSQPESRVENLLALAAAKADNPFLPFLQQRLASLLSLRPHVVVMSVYYLRQLPAALTLGGLLKEAADYLHVTLEGRVPTALAALWPQHPALFNYFDSVVVGQSEKPLLSLARSRAEGEPLSQVSNLIYQVRGVVQVNDKGEPEAVEALPVPDFEGLPLERYLAPHQVLPLQAARGCYWGRCRFCAYNVERDFAAYQPRSARWLGEAMGQLVARYGTNYFAFADEAVAPDLLEAIASEILRLGLKVWWQAQTRPEASLTLERCRLLAQSGCVSLQFCFETASDSLSRRMDMGLSQVERKMALTNCAQAGILTHIFVVLGLPGERGEEAEETASFVLENRDVIHGLSVEPYVLAKCTPLAEKSVCNSQVAAPPADDLSLHLTDWTVADGMSRAEVEGRCLSLRRAVRSRFPAFAASYFPVLLYAPHYCSRDLSKLVQRGQERGLSDVSAFNRRYLCRRPEVVSGVFRFDLPTLRRYLEESTAAEVMLPLQRPMTCFLDGPSGPVVQAPPQAAYVLGLADGSRDGEAIAQATAARFGLSEEAARTRSGAFLQLYRAFLEQSVGQMEER